MGLHRLEITMERMRAVVVQAVESGQVIGKVRVDFR
jgi:hypothetical protein